MKTYLVTEPDGSSLILKATSMRAARHYMRAGRGVDPGRTQIVFVSADQEYEVLTQTNAPIFVAGELA